MDSYTVAQLTHILSEEAQMISNELKNNAQNMSRDAVVAKLNGLVTRMKYELRNKDADAVPVDAPAYNSNNNTQRSVVPLAEPKSYPHESQYNEAAPPSTNFLDAPPKPLTKTKSIPSSLSTFPHSQKPHADWRYVQTQSQLQKAPKKSVDEQSNLAVAPARRCLTDKKARSHSISYSTDFSRMKPGNNPKSQKIVVNVIRDKPSSKKSITWERHNGEPIISAKSQRPILKGNNNNNNTEKAKPRAARSSAAVSELAEATSETSTAEKSRRSQSKPKAEQIPSVDRRVSKSTERKPTEPKRDRLQSSKTHTMSKSLVPFVPVSKYILDPPPLYRAPPMIYPPPPKQYTSMPRYNYPTAAHFSNTNSLYPFIFYRY